MNSTPFFESNESKSLAQGSDWHAQKNADLDYLKQKVASTESLFEVDSIGAFEFTDAVRPGRDSSLACSRAIVERCFVQIVVIWNYQ